MACRAAIVIVHLLVTLTRGSCPTEAKIQRVRVTERTTTLVRTANLQAFRDALVTLACDGDPLDARDRVVVVPTRAAAAQLTRTIENQRLGASGAVVLPDLITPGELVTHLAERIALDGPVLRDAEREVLLWVACHAVEEGRI